LIEEQSNAETIESFGRSICGQILDQWSDKILVKLE